MNPLIIEHLNHHTKSCNHLARRKRQRRRKGKLLTSSLVEAIASCFPRPRFPLAEAEDPNPRLCPILPAGWVQVHAVAPEAIAALSCKHAFSCPTIRALPLLPLLHIHPLTASTSLLILASVQSNSALCFLLRDFPKGIVRFSISLA